MRLPSDRIQDEPPPGYLAMVCWCEKHHYFVPARWVWEGLAPSCGPGCQGGKA